MSDLREAVVCCSSSSMLREAAARGQLFTASSSAKVRLDEWNAPALWTSASAATTHPEIAEGPPGTGFTELSGHLWAEALGGGAAGSGTFPECSGTPGPAEDETRGGYPEAWRLEQSSTQGWPPMAASGYGWGGGEPAAGAAATGLRVAKRWAQEPPDKNKDSLPTWGGSEPAKNLKAYGEALRNRCHNTSGHEDRHGSRPHQFLPQ